MNTDLGLGKTRLYTLWAAMKARCYYKRGKNYPRYGGRGIKVCEEWKEDYLAFSTYVRKLPNAPSKKVLDCRDNSLSCDRSIDRINNDKDYQPGNIKWSTLIEQNNNQSKTVMITFKNKTMSLRDAVRKYSKEKYITVYFRYVRYGWSVEESLLGKA